MRITSYRFFMIATKFLSSKIFRWKILNFLSIENVYFSLFIFSTAFLDDKESLSSATNIGIFTSNFLAQILILCETITKRFRNIEGGAVDDFAFRIFL